MVYINYTRCSNADIAFDQHYNIILCQLSQYHHTLYNLPGDPSSGPLSVNSITTVTTATRPTDQPLSEDHSAKTTPVLKASTASDEKRLEEIFSRTFQQEQEEMNSKNYRPKDTLSEKVRALSESKESDKKADTEKEEKEEEEEEGEFSHMYISLPSISVLSVII